ncbi:hypothetical protein [Streptomyces sp. H39-S7]|uniref:hypothetical protein n=1 Tax=Streptomyces sp. H39-S7 TaxID=3004357 RepID=UPI0022AE9A5A|nr:hypothetical protein [Streptomyces sp. H39-S7]MCZ4123199.1 hypothetical protein [Streptomyces sp. H39-S7]
MVTDNIAEDPGSAYALAPSIIREITWVFATARNFGRLTDPRQYWLRKAAVFDRIALSGQCVVTDANAAAEEAAGHLIEHDRAGTTDGLREYVRREYARWSATQ